MSTPALILAFILYVIIAVDQLRKKDYGMFLVWGGYSIGQVGFILHNYLKDNPPQ